MSVQSNLELLIGTGNQGKIREIQLAFHDLPLKLRLLEEFPNISTPEESGDTYAENAIIKAQSYADQTGLLALADDSGIEVAALNGDPGVRSARFGGGGMSDADRTRLLLAKLDGTENAERAAEFICVVAIAQPGRGVINLERGTCPGTIAREPNGEGGFGYDPVFIPDGYQLTFGQLPNSLKNQISHRAKALIATRRFFAESRSGNLTLSVPDS